ncbi:MAG: hypothetical protein KJ905_00255 [Nanoarchaeota archaeon]|nr:hypothetical protein [Nanoarchaeota archaeon]MBU1501192.1 hypothetical protein [Nanoarchaeota archaeon]
MVPKLHHFCFNISPTTLELVLELFKELGCNLTYREGNSRWFMVGQKPIPIDIQIVEVKRRPVQIKDKISTHVAFLSDNPKRDIEQISRWAKKKKIKFKQGGWSDKERWFDLPEVFVNFVIEIMHTSIVE